MGELKGQAVAFYALVRNSLNSPRSCSPRSLAPQSEVVHSENSCLSVKAQFRHCLLQKFSLIPLAWFEGPFSGIPSVTSIMEFVTPVCICHSHQTGGFPGAGTWPDSYL